MSILVICRMAWFTLPAAGEPINSIMRVGMICQETPYLSFSQPHWPGAPPLAVGPAEQGAEGVAAGRGWGGHVSGLDDLQIDGKSSNLTEKRR